MKKLMLILFVFAAAGFAQTERDTEKTTVIDSDTRDCIQKIYDNPQALKELMSTLMKDKETMRRIHTELRNDPEMRKMMDEMHREMDRGHKDDNMMDDSHMHMDMHKAEPGDTTRIK